MGAPSKPSFGLGGVRLPLLFAHSFPSPTKHPAPPSHGDAAPEHREGEPESIYIFGVKARTDLQLPPLAFLWHGWAC